MPGSEPSEPLSSQNNERDCEGGLHNAEGDIDENNHGSHRDCGRSRVYMEYLKSDVDSSEDDEKMHDTEENFQDFEAEENAYSALPDDGEDDFGDFVGPDIYTIDDETLFTRVLANLDLQNQPRSAPRGIGGTSFTDQESESDNLYALGNVHQPASEISNRISIPPLDAEKKAKIIAAMSNIKLKPRPGADILADSLLRSYQQGRK